MKLLTYEPINLVEVEIVKKQDTVLDEFADGPLSFVPEAMNETALLDEARNLAIRALSQAARLN